MICLKKEVVFNFGRVAVRRHERGDDFDSLVGDDWNMDSEIRVHQLFSGWSLFTHIVS